MGEKSKILPSVRILISRFSLIFRNMYCKVTIFIYFGGLTAWTLRGFIGRQFQFLKALCIWHFFWRLGISFVARRCTFLIAFMSFALYGFQTAFAYSNCGRTKALNRHKNISSSMKVNARRIIPIIWLALLIFSCIWTSKFSWQSIVTPRSLFVFWWWWLKKGVLETELLR